MTKSSTRPGIFHYKEIDWDNPLATGAPGTVPPKALVEQARKTGARRKNWCRVREASS